MAFPEDTIMQSLNNGGYPSGYSPIQSGQSNYSPFVSPYPNPQPFVQGGTTVSQGGFNPVSGTVTPVVAGSGFNPYTKFIGNPGYNPGQQIQLQQQGIYPYYPQNSYNGFINPYYGQNVYNQQVQDSIYQEYPSAPDMKEILEGLILTDEEREKIGRRQNNFIIGTDYYGRPIYANNAYQASQQRQAALEEARKKYQTQFTNLARIAHAYSGEEIDEEATMRRFDPIPPPPQRFDYSTATEEEKREYERECNLRATFNIINQITNTEYREETIKRQVADAYAQIKASHDKLLGVKPGEHYGLKTFMENGYKIGINAAMQKAKSANRNGTNKYSQNGFRAGLSQISNSQVPITSKDDEYVPIEQLIKDVYSRNKAQTVSIIKSQEGQIAFMPNNASSAELEAHKRYMEAIQEKKRIDDIQRSVL